MFTFAIKFPDPALNHAWILWGFSLLDWDFSRRYRLGFADRMKNTKRQTEATPTHDSNLRNTNKSALIVI